MLNQSFRSSTSKKACSPCSTIASNFSTSLSAGSPRQARPSSFIKQSYYGKRSGCISNTPFFTSEGISFTTHAQPWYFWTMLITSISGIRGTIEGSGEGLTPRCCQICHGVCAPIREATGQPRPTVVVGRREESSSGPAGGTLNAAGVDVVDLGLSTTPTVELAVPAEQADGGILTASHNPRQWNALKLLDATGEFLSAAAGERVLTANALAEYVDVDAIGGVTDDPIDGKHVAHAWPWPCGWRCGACQIQSGCGWRQLQRWNHCADAAGSPGCEVVKVHRDPTGQFAHNPEPLPAHLTDSVRPVKEGYLGISVDPDDRLAFGGGWKLVGEEYT